MTSSNLLRTFVIAIAALAMMSCEPATVTHPSGQVTSSQSAPTAPSLPRSLPTPTPTLQAVPAELPAVAPAATPAAPIKGPGPDAKAGSAIAVLATLTVKGRAPKTGYTRQQFGQSWRDLDRNGCDQRNDVLRRDLKNFTLKAGTHGCLVLSGTLISPYTGQTINFVRGVRTSGDVQIDHSVALSDAWQKGAQSWSRDKRESFANDFLELRAVDGHSNASKGAGDAATWLPPRKSFRCGYVARQIAVKKKYGLWVTSAERDAMARILSSCPRQGLPRAYPIKLGGGPERTVATTAEPKAGKPAPLVSGGPSYFKNCTAVRAAGRAPIRRGQPGYARHLDRDGDGVGCE